MRAIFLPLLLAGCATAHHGEAGPAGIPYDCGGLPVRAVYLDGGWTIRARAVLTYSGRTIELRAAPAAEGMLYQGVQDDREVYWQVSGEQAWLTENIDDGSNVSECVRVRDGAAEPPAHH